VPVRTIRFYEQASLLPAPERTPSGYRIYVEDAITRLRIVRSAQALGLSLAEIADMLRVRDADGPPCTYVTELLQTRIHASTVRITELTALREELSARLPLRAEPDPTRRLVGAENPVTAPDQHLRGQPTSRALPACPQHARSLWPSDSSIYCSPAY
jgi:DNA-binding transcriptional MerR regulator